MSAMPPIKLGGATAVKEVSLDPVRHSFTIVHSIYFFIIGTG